MKKNVSLFVVLALWLGLTVCAWAKPADASSDSERRTLAQMPELTAKSLLSGAFMADFADYAVDQFPLRDGFRTLNAVLTYYGWAQSDNNGIYVHDGYAAKMEYPLNTDSLAYAAERFNELYDEYLSGGNGRILFAIVPDKSYYLAEEADVLSMDYEALYDAMEEKLPWAEFVELRDCLSLEDYYRTDTHWRQERITDAAEKIAGEFGVSLPEFAEKTVSRPFYGVYYGQSALPLAPDEMKYLVWDGWEACSVFSADTGETTRIYDENKLDSKDLYDFYLSGGMAVQTITNPNADPGRELIVFRDSFGSSLVPLLAAGYGKITLIDTRYIAPAMVGEYVDFSDQDVLFLYSTLVLNSSATLRK